MPPVLAAPLFVLSLMVTLAAARLFARRLDRLGVRFGFPEALIGLLTALAADGPEISSALFALFKGAHDVGVGVLVGSNGFNLAAMIGLSAVLTGQVRLARRDLMLEGSVGLLVTVLAGALLVGWLSPGVAAGGTVVVLVPYLVLILAGTGVAHPPQERPVSDSPTNPTHHLLGMIVLDVALIVAGSAGMVETALSLAGDWGIPTSILGVLILGPLTSIPNAATAVRLGLAGRGAALVGETFNSNTINLGAGVIVPSLFVTLAAISTLGKLQLAWLLVANLLTLFLLGRDKGMGRTGAVALIVMYLAFAAGTLVGS
jgi:cation:H+ antiporter